MATINVQARNCEIDNVLRAHFEDKLDSLERLWPGPGEAIVRVVHERGRYAAEVTLVSGGITTRGEERAGNLRQAFDNAVDKLEKQLQRYKTKSQARKRRHDNRDDAAGTVLNPTLPPSPGAAQAASVEEGEDEVVRIKRFALKPMSPEEAALQMDLLGHAFFVFRHAENNQVSVVYRRHGGGYGLIEPVSD